MNVPRPGEGRRLGEIALLGLSPLLAAAACGPQAAKAPGTEPVLRIESPAFADGGPIPAVHTCEGEDRSPALRFEGLPRGTRSLALIVEDPDAPDPRAARMTWAHWVLYDLPPDSSGLEEAVAELPAGAREGLNDWKRRGWGGPCPPVGRHRYFFKLHALDAVLGELGQPTRAGLLAAMEGHVLAEAELVGTYEKSGR